LYRLLYYYYYEIIIPIYTVIKLRKMKIVYNEKKNNRLLLRSLKFIQKHIHVYGHLQPPLKSFNVIILLT
jgi:hypothetical protein